MNDGFERDRDLNQSYGAGYAARLRRKSKGLAKPNKTRGCHNIAIQIPVPPELDGESALLLAQLPDRVRESA